MNAILGYLQLIRRNVATAAVVAEKQAATLQGGDVAAAETVLDEIMADLVRIDEVVSMAGGRALPPIRPGIGVFDDEEPVPFELVDEAGRAA